MIAAANVVPTPVVIVAEDEELVRFAIVEALIEEGFVVIEAGHAAEALAALMRQAAGVHVLFTDVQMPGAMDGLALAHHTRARWPWIAVLITSGAASVQGMARPVGSRFLPKPYASSDVVTHLRELLISNGR